MRMANAKRFHDRCQREFEAFRKERLASGELECQKLINAAQAHLTQVCIRQARSNLTSLSLVHTVFSLGYNFCGSLLALEAPYLIFWPQQSAT